MIDRHPLVEPNHDWRAYEPDGEASAGERTSDEATRAANRTADTEDTP